VGPRRVRFGFQCLGSGPNQGEIMTRIRQATYLMLLTATAALGACATPEPLRQADTAQCSSFGFTPGTDAFAGCMQKLWTERQQKSDAMFTNAVAASVAQAAGLPAAGCVSTDNGTSSTHGSSTSTTTGGPGSSTTTTSSSSSTDSAGISLSACTPH
jgi:hypothetical protein